MAPFVKILFLSYLAFSTPTTTLQDTISQGGIYNFNNKTLGANKWNKT